METDNGKKKTNAPPKGEPRRAPAAGADREGPGPEGNAPPLRFPGFAGEWEDVSLQNIAIVNPKTEPLQNTFFYIDLGAVEKGELKKAQVIMRAEAPCRAQRVLRNNDILFQCVRPYQKNNYIHRAQNTKNQQWVASTGYAQIRTTENPSYIYHLLNTDRFNRKVMVRCTGSSYPAINSEDLEEIHFYFAPDINEQLRISRLLDLLDERIAAQRALIGEMGRLIKGLNDTIYSRYCTEEETSFSKIGISYCGLQGKSAEDFGFGKPYISYLKVHNNRILDDSECELVNIRSGERQNLVRHGDVLFTLSSETPEEVGLGAVYLGTKEVYLNSFCFGIHFINPIVFPPYMAFFISTSYFRKFIFPFAQGSTRYNLQKADFEKATLHLPNLDHQKKIYAIMKSITHKLELEKRILQDYLLQKQYLLRKMFI